MTKCCYFLNRRDNYLFTQSRDKVICILCGCRLSLSLKIYVILSLKHQYHKYTDSFFSITSIVNTQCSGNFCKSLLNLSVLRVNLAVTLTTLKFLRKLVYEAFQTDAFIYKIYTALCKTIPNIIYTRSVLQCVHIFHKTVYWCCLRKLSSSK